MSDTDTEARLALLRTVYSPLLRETHRANFLMRLDDLSEALLREREEADLRNALWQAAFDATKGLGRPGWCPRGVRGGDAVCEGCDGSHAEDCPWGALAALSSPSTPPSELCDFVPTPEMRNEKHECQRCGSDEWEHVDYSGCSICRPFPEED